MAKNKTQNAKVTEFEAIKSRAEEIIALQGPVKDQYKEIADLYFMDNTPRINTKAYDGDDIRYTKSPSARNVVVGLHRMLRTSRPQFRIECDNEDWADKMEDALSAWWEASSERKPVSNESDLSLSAILFTEPNLEVTAVQDLLDIDGISPVRKRRLQDLHVRTPILFDVCSAFNTYVVWGEDERIEWLRAYLIKGKALRQRWGVQDVDDNRDYNFRDYYDLENRCVWITELDAPIIEPQQYDMPDIPGFSAMADGTLLFTEETRKRQPFLYAMLQSGLAKREDELLTVLFTSVYSRGVGPLALIDPDTLPTGGVQVNYQGLFRYITAKGIFADDKAYDANLLQLQGLIQQLNQQSTINSQTLGENISPGTPYSGYAMASQNGRIPIVPIQEACEKVIHDAAIFALRYYKQRNLNWKNAKGEELRAIDIPDVFKLTVKLEVDLPQDQFRMAQIASQLSATGYVSMEWVRNLLQIHDSRKMDFDIMAEKAMLAAFQQDLPNLVGQMLQAVGGTPTQPPPNTEYLGEVPRPEGEWRRGSGSQLGYHQMPDGSMMADSEMQGQNAMIPGGPDAAMAGGGSIPATEQLSPEQMNGGVAR